MDLLIIDDPLKPEDAMSDARREATNGWYTRTALSRLNNKAENAIILVQQRLHVDDLAGHVDQLEDWTVLRLPAIAEEDVEVPIGRGQVYSRKRGEVLHPAREPQGVLDSLKARTWFRDLLGPIPAMSGSGRRRGRQVELVPALFRTAARSADDHPPVVGHRLKGG